MKIDRDRKALLKALKAKYAAGGPDLSAPPVYYSCRFCGPTVYRHRAENPTPRCPRCAHPMLRAVPPERA